jgi:ribonuclease P protein component
MGFCLPKAERIRKRAEYVGIQTQGRKLFTPSLIAFTIFDDGAPLRLGITVSKRVGGAVVRARVKRLLREVFRQNKDRLPPGLQLVIVAKADAARLDFQHALGEFLEICRRYGPRTPSRGGPAA